MHVRIFYIAVIQQARFSNPSHPLTSLTSTYTVPDELAEYQYQALSIFLNPLRHYESSVS